MKLLRSIIKRFTDRDKDYRYQAIMGEVIPIFANRYNTTNKNNVLLNKNDERVNFVDLESQDGIPVEFHKDFDSYGKNKLTHRGDLNFEVDGIKAHMVYSLDRIGYLENSTGLYRVILVTDKFVYSQLLNSGGIIINSHNEMKRFKNMQALTVEKEAL